jgi:hypothetical protein
MKKLILHLSVFTIFVLIILFFVIGTMGMLFPKTFSKTIKNKRGDVGHMYTRLKELNSTGPVDVVVIGSSHAYRGFDPRIFAGEGIRIFDLGSSSQSPIQTEILIKKYIRRLKPKLVIYEVFPGVFLNDGVESSVDLISNGKIDYRTVLMALRINNLITYNTLFFHSFKKLFFKEKFNEPVCKAGECYIPGGFVQRTQIARYKGRTNNQLDSLNWIFRSDQINAFRRTMAFLKSRNCETILIQAPIAYTFFNSYYNNHEIDDFFRSFGVHYYNVNYSKIGNSNALFYDRDHLNMDGVWQFNKFVISIIRQNHSWE